MDNSLCGVVVCPACRARVPVEDKVCPECGQYVNYKHNLEVLAHWDLDLFNYAIKEIKDGFVRYGLSFDGIPVLGEENYYSLETCRSVIPNRYMSCNIRYDKAGVFVIHSEASWHSFNYGLLDKEGNEIIGPVCDEIQQINSQGHFIVKYQGKMGVVTIDNQNIIPIVYDSVKRASSLYNHEYYIVEKNGLFGMLDNRNEILVPIEFEGIGDYWYEPIAVCRNKKWGFFDSSTGSLVIPFKFDKASSFFGDCARVQIEDDAFFIDVEGYPTSPSSQEQRQGKEVIENGRVVVRDKNGEIVQKKVFDPKYEINGIKRHEVNGKYGAINPDGIFVIPPEYDELYILAGGLCPARKGDLYGHNWGVISYDGSCVLPFNFYHQTWVFEGIIRIHAVKPSGRGRVLQGYIDRFGNAIVPLEYESLSGFEEGLCWYETWDPKRFGIMDKFGNYVEYRPVIVNGQYKESPLRPFSDLPF